MTRPVRIAVCGDGAPSECDPLAYEVGQLLAHEGVVLLTGGLGGVMEAASRGACQNGGTVLGILPSYDTHDANPYVTLPIATGMGHGRNVILVASADAVIAIGGKWGTLSEIALARKLGRPVILLASWDLPAIAEERQGVHIAASPEEAVSMALSLAPASR